MVMSNIDQNSVGIPNSRRISIPVIALRRALLNQYGDSVQAILFYGSCWRDGKAHSTPEDLGDLEEATELAGGDKNGEDNAEAEGLFDLYVLVDSYHHAYHHWGLQLGNWLLPPNVFYVEITVAGKAIRAKYAVITLAAFQYGVVHWFHSYLWGRFAQPTQIIYTRHEGVAQQVTDAFLQAARTVILRTLPQMTHPFTAYQLWQTGLTLSYRAELRPEAALRVDQLLTAFAPYYEHITEQIVITLPTVTVHRTHAPIQYRVTVTPFQRWLNRRAWQLRFIQGKCLSIVRWLKAFFTFRGGVDYLAWKLQRHTGVTVEITPALRRYPWLYAWQTLWRLYRQGIIR